MAGIFDPPYYEYPHHHHHQQVAALAADEFPLHCFRSRGVECRNLDSCLIYLEQLMIREGPFDGLLGNSGFNITMLL